MSKNEITLEKGYVQVYTGNGKGKTTAALGLAFRAMGRGLKTYIGQFMKGQFYAELKSGAMVQPYITIEQYGSKDTHVQKPPRRGYPPGSGRIKQVKKSNVIRRI